MAKRFTEEEMRPDPEPEAPSFKVIEEDGAAPLPTSADRAQKWFDRNKITRVPLIALEKDSYRVPDQNWVVFSMIKPEEYGKLKHGNKEYHGYLIKFRGCFATKELATAHIHKVMKMDRHFDCHLIPAFQWSSIDDHAVEDREYADERIADIMKGYFQNENNRMIGIRDRIEKVEKGEGDRSREATKFFEDMQEEVSREKIDDGAVEATPVTLDELASDFDVKAGASVLEFSGGVGEKQSALVSEILLEEDEDDVDDLMKKKSS